ncbi:MAG: hypothetical protein H8F28_20255, partial [Fibrella sp.]|nr:hypothetical protein [Armatimonadota bacterium]
YLEEGAKNNPQSIEIQSTLGGMLTAKLHRYDEALPRLIKAIDLAEARDPDTLSEDEGEAWQFAYRWAVLGRRDANDPKAARDFARAGLKRFPDDPICKNYLGKADNKGRSRP